MSSLTNGPTGGANVTGNMQQAQGVNALTQQALGAAPGQGPGIAGLMQAAMGQQPYTPYAPQQSPLAGGMGQAQNVNALTNQALGAAPGQGPGIAGLIGAAQPGAAQPGTGMPQPYGGGGGKGPMHPAVTQAIMPMLMQMMGMMRQY